MDGLAGHIATRRKAQMADHGGDLFGMRFSRHGTLGAHRGYLTRRLATSGIDMSGRHHVDIDAVLPELIGEHARQPDDTHLRCAHVGPAPGPHVRRSTPETDDAAAAGGNDVRRCRVRHEEHAVEIHREDLTPLREAGLQKRLLTADGGVAHQDIKAPQIGHGRVDETLAGRLIDEIAEVHDGLSALRGDLITYRSRRRTIPLAVNHDRCAVIRQRVCDRPPDVTCGPGDDCDLSFQHVDHDR
jgi:hypothetical protein